MMFLLIITAIAIFLIVGFVFIELGGFLKEETLLSKISYSWGLGVGLIGLQLFLYSICNINWSVISILLPWFIPVVIFFNKKQFPKIKKIKFKFTRVKTIFAVLLILLLLFTGFESVLRPVYTWDGWDNWVFRPKVFYLHNNLNLDYVRYTGDEYPLIIPLMGTFGYIIMGGINDTYVLLLFFMFYVALGGLFFSYTKKHFGTKQALIWTFLLLSLQNVIRHGGRYEAGQADLALGYYFLLGTILLADFLKTKSKNSLLLLSIFLGIIGQIKNDGLGFVFVVIPIILFVILKWKRFQYIVYLIPVFIITLLWEVYKKINHYPTNFVFNSGINLQLYNVPLVLHALLKEFLNLQNWNLLWLVFFIALIICWRNLRKIKLLLSIIISQWLLYFIILLITPIEPDGQVIDIADKLYLHIAPLAVLILCFLLNLQLKDLKNFSWKKYFI